MKDTKQLITETEQPSPDKTIEPVAEERIANPLSNHSLHTTASSATNPGNVNNTHNNLPTPGIIQRVQFKPFGFLQFQRDVFTLQRLIGNRAVVQLLKKFSRPAKATSPHLTSDSVHQHATAGVQGAGQKLPYYKKLQKAFGRFDLSHVKAYTGQPAQTANKALGSEAYTIGNRVAFATSTPDLSLAAHEVTHVIQQQAGIYLEKGIGTAGDRYEQEADAVARNVVRGQSAEPLLAPYASAIFEGVPPLQHTPHSVYTAIQFFNGQFTGPPLLNPAGALVNLAFGGHNVFPFANWANTGACLHAKIETDGQKYDNAAHSDPGVLLGMNAYNHTSVLGYKWSRKGGLVRDKVSNKAATLMHALNHHLDPTSLNNDPNNIFMGTTGANNNHKNKVENPIKNFVKKHLNKKGGVTGDNTLYEAEMANATVTTNKATGNRVLYWAGNTPLAAGIDNQALNHGQLIPCIADSTNYEAGVTFHGMFGVNPNDEQGQALEVNANTPSNNFYHPWISYQVTPIYTGQLNNYVVGNYNYEVSKLDTPFTPPTLPANTLLTALVNTPAALGEILLSFILPLPQSDLANILAVGPAAAAAQILQGINSWPAAAIYFQQLQIIRAAALFTALPGPDQTNLAGELVPGYASALHANFVPPPAPPAPAPPAPAMPAPAMPAPAMPPPPGLGALAARAGIAAAAAPAPVGPAVIVAPNAPNQAAIIQMIQVMSPLFAADYLTGLVANQAALLLGNIPTAQAAAIVEKMPSVQATAAIQLLTAAIALPLMNALTPGGAGRLLQGMAANMSAQIFGSIPAAVDAAATLQHMTPVLLAPTLVLLPSATLIPILAAAPAARHLAQVMTALPNNSRAKILGDLCNAGSAELSANILQAMGLAVAPLTALVQLFPQVTAGQIVIHLPATTVIGIVLQLPNNNWRAQLIGQLMNQDIGKAAHLFRGLVLAPAAAAAIVRLLPVAVADNLLAEVAVDYSAGVLQQLPNNNWRAEVLAHIVGINAVRAARIMLAIGHAAFAAGAAASADEAVADVIQLLPRNNVRDILIQLQEPEITPILQVAALANNLRAEILGAIAGVNANLAADVFVHLGLLPVNMAAIIMAWPAATISGILQHVPVANLVPLLNPPTLTDQQIVSILAEIHNVNAPVAVQLLQGILAAHGAVAAADVFRRFSAVRNAAIWPILTPVQQGAINGAPPIAGLAAAPAVDMGVALVAALPVVLPLPGVALVLFQAALPAVFPPALPAGVLPVGAPANAFPPALPVAALPAPPLAAAPNAPGANFDAAVDASVLANPNIPQARVKEVLAALTPGTAAALGAALPGGSIARHRIEKLPTFLTWAKQAFPTAFRAEVTYYTASYDPANRYYAFSESDIYPTET